MTDAPFAPPRWWQTRRFALAAIALSIVPLVWPALPPLTDLPGHIGRYRIMVEAGQMPLARHFGFHWALIGNLGVDLIVWALHPLLDIEASTRLVVMSIPPLTVAAMIWLAREAHGRVPPAAAFAFPLVYGFPFQFGFVNFALSAALALGGLALWLRLARTRAAWVRVAVLVPIACLTWVCHSFGWAMLGLFIFGADWVLRWQAGSAPIKAAILAGLACAPMALPQVAAMALPHDPLVGPTGDWFNWAAKAQWLISLLRERWERYDLICLLVILLLLGLAIRSKRLDFVPVLAVPAVLGSAAFILLPRYFAGGTYVDMRLVPYVAALALLAIRATEDDAVTARRLALCGAAFFVLRTVSSTLAFAEIGQGQQRELGAIDVMPAGSAVLALVDEHMDGEWASRRLTHIAGMAIARRRVFTNEQWALPGQQLVMPLHPRAAPFDRDPSQLVYRNRLDSTQFDQAIACFDRATFDYVWTIGFPPGRARAPDLRLMWSNGGSALYRVLKAPDRRPPNTACPQPPTLGKG